MQYEMNDILKMNFMVDGNFDLINATDNIQFKSVLDIGLGEGGASTYFALKGKKVTAIGLEIESYNYPKALFETLHVKVIETTFEDFKTDEKYDAIWASHVLEHTLNTGLFLEKCKSLLSDDGWLFIMVPPYKDKVVGGHVNNGWNMGQLMYNLLLTGYDIKHGHFIQHGYNICAFVQKSKETLPKIRMDIGDIESTRHLWPIEVQQGFDGNINNINWFKNFKKYEEEKKTIILLQENLEEKDRELLKLQNELEEKDRELLKLQNKLEEKDRELLKLQNELEEKGYIFSDKRIENILIEMQPKIEDIKKNMIETNNIKKIQNKTLFQYYEESRLKHIVQPVKRIPLLGKTLLFLKRNILHWKL